MPPTESMDMAGKSSTAISGDTGDSGDRGYQRGPPTGLETPWPQGLTWGGEGDEQRPTSVEGAKGDSGDTWGQDPENPSDSPTPAPWEPGHPNNAPFPVAPHPKPRPPCPPEQGSHGDEAGSCGAKAVEDDAHGEGHEVVHEGADGEDQRELLILPAAVWGRP